MICEALEHFAGSCVMSVCEHVADVRVCVSMYVGIKLFSDYNMFV